MIENIGIFDFEFINTKMQQIVSLNRADSDILNN